MTTALRPKMVNGLFVVWQVLSKVTCKLPMTPKTAGAFCTGKPNAGSDCVFERATAICESRKSAAKAPVLPGTWLRVGKEVFLVA
jgi:hypothetical protein